MKISGIYKIQSIKKPDRIYIGSSNDISKRWKGHLHDLKNGKHHSKKLQRHYDKYGVSDLQFSILIGCDKVNLITNEQFFIDSYSPYFNGRIKAESNLGLKRGEPWNKGKKATEQAKINQSKSHKGQQAWNKGKKTGKTPWNKGMKGVVTFKMPEYAKTKISKAMMGNKRALGHVMSDESLRKMRNAQANRPSASEDTRRKISLSKKGNKYSLGRVVTEETKEKIRKSLTGRKQPIELREKLSKIRKEWYKNNESKVKGISLSIEHKAKITAGLRKHYRDKELEKYDIVTKN